MKQFTRQLLQDIKRDLLEKFDRNFESKSFFGKPWSATKLNKRGTLMMRSGKLSNSIKASVNADTITFTSALPYASIHNEGGTITITPKMQKFFWAMYYKSAGAITFSVKTKKANATKRNQNLSAEASYWKSLALKKVGDKLHIEQRQFIGDHPQVRKTVEHRMDLYLKEIENQIKNQLKQKR